jgi:Ca2+-binding RTX toxin-like protein
LGGVDVTLEALADEASIDLRNPDDTATDADDAVTITFNGDTGADDVTINGGAGEENITITNGDLDDLEINAGAGNDTINLDGAGGDNIEIAGGAGNDAITGTDDDEEINGGAGDDTITGGAAADQIATGAGDDTVIMTDARTTDVVSDFAVGANADHFDLDLSDLEDATTGLGNEGNTAVDFVEVNDAASVTGGAISFQTIETDDTAAAADATGFLLDGDFADLDAALTAMEDQGGLSIAHGAVIEANDSFVFVFDDGTDSFLATATFTVADDNNAGAANIADNELEGDILAELSGVNDAASLTNANVDFI